MNELVADLELPKAVQDEFRVGFQVKMALAAIEQEKLNQVARERDHRLIEGMGQLVARIDPDVYWCFVHKFGPGCWRDKGFLKDCIKKGLISKPVSKSNRTSLRVNGLKSERQTTNIITT